jgi:hypothetical protein
VRACVRCGRVLGEDDDAIRVFMVGQHKPLPGRFMCSECGARGMNVVTHDDTEQTALEYAGTSGFAAGSPSSEASVRSADVAGVTARRQRMALRMAAAGALNGVTVAELRSRAGMHHGSASSALSNLHKAGRLERLAERRGRCAIYVLPEYVNERMTEPQGHRGHALLDRMAAVLREFVPDGGCLEHPDTPGAGCVICRVAWVLAQYDDTQPE